MADPKKSQEPPPKLTRVEAKLPSGGRIAAYVNEAGFVPLVAQRSIESINNGEAFGALPAEAHHLIGKNAARPVTRPGTEAIKDSVSAPLASGGPAHGSTPADGGGAQGIGGSHVQDGPGVGSADGQTPRRAP
jgi:hypothetical protein